MHAMDLSAYWTQIEYFIQDDLSIVNTQLLVLGPITKS